MMNVLYIWYDFLKSFYWEKVNISNISEATLFFHFILQLQRTWKVRTIKSKVMNK